ncbi:hypothetical protein [Streptomyces rapamycinicus]|uniref:Transposase n=1 Tax=Streptomyces rapamycinicus TaxID=1226757 RepID=A0ABR6LRA4_9ACTN|nr:hypothetical protein [Streptomyces rapamycinicus]AGP56351.1 hypothetical protein M271_24285 [Streptomyces rapamycinicus NRRL 5491]MBB4783949.1 hypothetical protein [Streptomyces rapamycinicus]UTO64305.1 hypothetical protein LJB45_19560 [Streptomyces rapamycinicus]UTP32260.1 hypothetical protein LIV37_24685 [Streptomyces rapamycinicus NRRL 5491]
MARAGTGARRSLSQGTLRQGVDILRQLGEHIDGDAAQEIFGASGPK